MATAGPERTASARRPWDVVLAVALLVVLAGLALVGAWAGAFLVMASDSCGSATACSEGRLSAGVFVAAVGPAVVTVVAIASVIERLVRARLAFWPPLVGIAAAVLVWSAGAALVFSAVPA